MDKMANEQTNGMEWYEMNEEKKVFLCWNEHELPAGAQFIYIHLLMKPQYN